MYGFIFLILILFVSQTASSDKTEDIEKAIITEESVSYSIEARKEKTPIMVMEYYEKSPEDRMCESLDEIIEILKEDGVESK